jgi:hypothetical protein
LDEEKSKTTQLTEERNILKTKANELQKSKQALEQAAEQKHLEYEKLTRFASLDPDVHAAYKKMVNDFLIKAMKERMGG